MVFTKPVGVVLGISHRQVFLEQINLSLEDLIPLNNNPIAKQLLKSI
jgi:hypothetical protein